MHHDHAQKLFGRMLEEGGNPDLVPSGKFAPLDPCDGAVQPQRMAHHVDLVVKHHLVDRICVAQVLALEIHGVLVQRLVGAHRMGLGVSAQQQRTRPTRAARGLANFQRVDQGIEALEKSLSISATTPPSSAPSKWRSIMFTTSCTNRSRCTCMMAAGVGPTKSIMKSSRESASFVFLVFIKLGVVEGDLDGSTLLCQIVEVHAHFVERLTEILIAPHRPAHLQGVGLGIELDARLFLIGTGGAIGQRTRTRIFPQGLEGILQLLIVHIRTQLHLAVHMDFEGSVVIDMIESVVVPRAGVEPARPFSGSGGF
jgi:hypothetical protein